MRIRHVLLLAALSAGVALPARAQVSVYYHIGVWDAFDGPGDNGHPVCGIGNRNPSDGTSFSLRFPIGGNDVTFTAAKTGWNIPDGTRIPVVIQIGLEQPWTEQAIGNGDRLRWTLDRVNAQIFDDQFRRATSMTVTYPSGSEPPWIISLAGSTAASNAMGRCVTDLTRRAATQPITAPPTSPEPGAPSPATQPFSAAPPSAPDNTTQDNATQDNATQNNAAQPQPPTQQPPTSPAPETAPSPAH